MNLEKQIERADNDFMDSMFLVVRIGLLYAIINVLFYASLMSKIDTFIDVMLYYVMLFGGIFVLSIFMALYCTSMQLKLMKKRDECHDEI